MRSNWLGGTAPCRTRPLAGEAVIPAIPSSHPNLDIGNPPLFPVEVQGNACIAPPPGDGDCMLAGSDGYPCFQWCSPPSHLRENHSNPPQDIESRQSCLPLPRCTRFFSQRPKPFSLVVLVGWDWSRTSRPSSIEGGVGVSPTKGILNFPQVRAADYLYFIICVVLFGFMSDGVYPKNSCGSDGVYPKT